MFPFERIGTRTTFLMARTWIPGLQNMQVQLLLLCPALPGQDAQDRPFDVSVYHGIVHVLR